MLHVFCTILGLQNLTLLHNMHRLKDLLSESTLLCTEARLTLADLPKAF